MESSLRALALVGLATATALAALGACFPGSGPPLIERVDAEMPTGPTLEEGGVAPRRDVDLGDPFAIDGLVPSHGPWTGGTRAKLSGRGFPSKLRVWIGGTELEASAIFASDPLRAAITTPRGTPGPADVRVRDDLTAQERTLTAGFFYDAFVVVPDSGATTGGTRISLEGSGTTWKTGLEVAVAGKPCTDVAVVDATHLQCTTPAGAPGVADVTVTTPGSAPLQARDAFVYSDSPDGYRGGLSGGALAGTLKVLAYDAFVGTPLVGGRAIAGGVLSTALVKQFDTAGAAVFTSPTLQGKVTVTVVAKCHQPATYVDVPVDTVTVYLNPTLDPACAEGDPPSTGGTGGRFGGQIDGEIVWPGGVELAKSGWTTVPQPTRPTERRAAYVFTAAGSPLDAFNLPAAESATTPDSPGARGYGFAITTFPGNQTVYALAGLEDRSIVPPRFVPYVMGSVRGVPVQPMAKTLGVYIPMTTLLDHKVSLGVQPPARGVRGPDRLVSQLAVSLGEFGFAVLPIGLQISLLPFGGGVDFIGVPALDGALAGESYVVGASAVTGVNRGLPASVVSRVRTTQANTPVTVGGFLNVPELSEPGTATWNGTHVNIGASGTYDLLQVVITSGGGLVAWTIVAPAGATSFDLPNIATLPDSVGLVPGGIQTTATIARLDQFAYGKLRSGQLATGSWSAYAFDSLNGAY